MRLWYNMGMKISASFFCRAKNAFFASLLLLATVTAIRADIAPDTRNIFTDGAFYTGCNYWASHAGVYMWRDWNGDQVEKDLAVLKRNGVDVVRVFPLWSDFQPLTATLGYLGGFCEMTQAGRPLENEAGVDETMMARFRFMCDAAAKNDMKLVVGLVTGWMSGRFFAPPALERMNAVADSESVMWQVRFVRHFVREMKDHPAIAAWDLGNECNCMGKAESSADAWNWMNTITSAIHAEDRSRPVVSGMHSCPSDMNKPWNLRHQGELNDILTAHPYPLFTPECANEDFDTMRNACHPTAESLFYAGLSGKPCFIEEVGDLGRCTASPERSAATVRAGLFTAWAHGLSAYLWWCGFDQDRFDFAPYSRKALERELGLLTADGEPKPTAREMAAFRSFLAEFPYAKLPERRIDAVCLVSEMEDGWTAAFGAFLLARQAGFNIAFAGAEQKSWPESKMYILPSGSGGDPYTLGAWNRVLEKAREGATVVISKGNRTRYSGFLQATGNQIETFNLQSREFKFSFNDGKTICGGDETTTVVSSVSSDVLAKTDAGDPVVTVKTVGKGRIVFVNFPMEIFAARSSNCFAGDDLNPLYVVYRKAASLAGIERVVSCGCPSIGLTEHVLDNGKVIVVAVNYEPRAIKTAFAVTGKISKVWRGRISEDAAEIGANDAAVFEVERKEGGR